MTNYSEAESEYVPPENREVREDSSLRQQRRILGSSGEDDFKHEEDDNSNEYGEEDEEGASVTWSIVEDMMISSMKRMTVMISLI